MKHTDRLAIGLELYFSARSASFSGLKDYSSSDIKDMIENTPDYARYPVAREMHSALCDLLASDLCPRQHIPEDVARIASERSAFRCCGDRPITAFFSWLIDIARRNETDRVERVSGLNTAASCFDTQTSSFIRTGLALNNQRVVITREDDTIRMSFAEREWGRVCIDFTGCETDAELPPLPMLGYAFSTEAERLGDGCFQFRILVDTLFTDSDYCERLLSSEGWHEVSFICKSARADIVCLDYAGRLERAGTPRAEIIDRVCSALLSKKSILGGGALSPDESSMLPVAELISGTGGLLTEPRSQQWQSEQLVLDSLDNRYAMQQLGRLLEDGKCEQLRQYLELSSQARFDDDEHKALASARRYASLYEQQLADGSARPLALLLSGRFMDMTGGFDGTTPRCLAEAQTADRVMSTVSDSMKKLRFEGQFPHYRRLKRRNAEYLSFMLLPAADRSRYGVFSFYVSLAAAKISGRRLRQLKEHGIDAQLTNALDCQPEISSVCKYGELASADDGEYVRVDIDMFGSSRQRKLRDDSAQLERYIRIAERQFRFGSIPGSYAASRSRKGMMPSPLPRLFLTSLPLSAVLSLLAVIGWLLASGYFPLPGLTISQALGGAAILCAALNSIITIIRRIHSAGQLWRYR